MNYIEMNTLNGSKVTGGGVEEDIPFMDFEKDGVKYRGQVLRDPEGNGPGFMFGLPTPTSAKVLKLQKDVQNKPSRGTIEKLNRLWAEEYYGSLIGAEVLKTGASVPDEEGMKWPYLVMELTVQGHEVLRFKVEISCDQEGNHPGFLDIIAIP